MHPVAPAIVMENITKRFGQNLANDSISLTISSGTIHALVGENGAGKSTIMKILYGLYQPDGGDIFLNGEIVEIKSPSVAISLGIGMVHQHFMLVENLSVLENIILGIEPRKGLFIDTAKATGNIRTLLSQMEIDLDLHKKIKDLSIGEQQIVELVKILYLNAKIIILDEPTAVLTPQETEKLFTILKNLKNLGKTIIIITHKLPEVMQITETITVLRSGKKVVDLETKTTNIPEIATWMIGKPIESNYDKRAFSDRSCVVEVDRVCWKKENSEILTDISFKIHSHEILGIAGIAGNGQIELEEIVSGLLKPTSGKVTTPPSMGHIPEDRHKSGLILDWTMSENMMLGHHRRKQYRPNYFYQKKSILAVAQKLMKSFQVHPCETELKARDFSGGNQQKLILARELENNPEFVLVSQPTRGVDIGAIQFIHQKLLQLRNQGTAILLISADLEELLQLSDRILVIYKGALVGEVDPKETSEKQLGLLMTGQKAA